MELVRRLMPLTLLILSCLAELTMAEAEGRRSVNYLHQYNHLFCILNF
ncbi:CUZD1 isoform 4 [Pan troglodytes]|uniref:CUB and zona pellucida like domains 1 n=2 Tax=Homininae TaxID=207598 RepID=A0A0A0MRA6_HUMAN|nr:CUZD1 isoform 4 [Pan troglodytes]